MLHGTRVLDLSGDAAGAYAGRMLALLGADVVKVEPPSGDATRRRGPRRDETGETSALFASLNTSKRSVVVDPDTVAGRGALLSLVERAEVVIEDATPGWWRERGLDFEVLTRSTGVAVCSITPFGQAGPRAGWRMTALTAAAAGGQMMLCGDPDDPPLKTAGHQAAMQAGLHGFAATLTALFAARRDGVGEWVDISMQEAQAASLEGFGPTAMVRGLDSERAGNQARAVWGIYPCADGFVGVASMARQTGSVYRCIGHPELTETPVFADLAANPEANEFVASLVLEWTMQRTAREIFDESQRHRAPFSLIPTPRDLLEWPPLREAGFWSDVDHPALGRHSLPRLPFSLDGRFEAPRRAPLLGEHTAEVMAEAAALPARTARVVDDTPRRPLEGIRVLDMTQVWAGPYATRFLADMGADVIHLEGPSFPDAVRGVGRGDDPRSFNKAPYFNEYNRNKRGLAMDLHRPEGLEAFRRIARQADVVIENWSVGVSERLGIGFADLQAINPRLSLVQMPGFAQQGPEAERVGFGPTIEQMGGLVALQGYVGGQPHKSGISYGDPTGGITAAGATVAALLQREQTGRGAHVVVSQRDNILGMVGEFMVAESAGLPYPVREGSHDPDAAPHNVYRTRDDHGRMQGDILGREIGEFHDTWLAIAVDSDESWAALRGVVADPHLDDPAYATHAGRKAHEAAIDAVIEAWARERDASAEAARLQAVGVSALPVMSPLMLVRDEHLQARGFFPTTVHPEAGEHTVTRPVWLMRHRPQPPIQPAPCFGEHNVVILRELAGYSDTDLERFEADGVIATVPLKA